MDFMWESCCGWVGLFFFYGGDVLLCIGISIVNGLNFWVNVFDCGLFDFVCCEVFFVLGVFKVLFRLFWFVVWY